MSSRPVPIGLAWSPVMGTEKRERQKANRQERREREASQQKRDTNRNRLVFAVVGGAIALVLLFLISQTLGGDDDSTATGATTTLTIPDDDTDDSDAATGGEDIDAATDDDAGAATDNSPPTTAEVDLTPVDPECPPEDGSDTRVVQFTSAPPMCIDDTATYEAVFDTSEGSFTIEMDAATAPATVNNFVFLARYHYYDGVAFHRIIPGFVVQGGDAVGDLIGGGPGTGGPGYSFADELPEEGAYQIGSVAMANSGPDTNGSQFFIITGDNGASLPPQYSLFGTVTSGMDTVEALESLGTDSGAPTTVPVINSVTISEK